MKQSKMHPNTMRHTKIWVQGPMGWIGCVRCEEFRCDFMARTFALITPVQPVLHRVSCSNETLPNAPKHYEAHQNMSLGSNGVDLVCSLRKIPMRLRGTNFCFNCTNSTHFALRVVMKQSKMHPNTMRHTKTWVYGPMGWIGCVRCEKFSCDFMARTSALIVPVQLVLHRVLCSNETLPNAPKYYGTHQNMRLGSNGVDRVSSLWKFRCNFVARTFALIALVQPVLHRVWCSNEILPNTPKHYETHQNMSLGSNVLNWVCSLQKILMHCMARTSALIAPV